MMKAIVQKWALGLLLAAFGLPVAALGQETPRVQQGRIDLGVLSKDETKPIALAGDWAFYWQQLLAPTDFVLRDPIPTGYLAVPNSWDTYIVNGQPLPAHGYATYQLRMTLPAGGHALGLQMPYIWTSYRVYVNGQLAATSGQPGTRPAEATSQMLKNLIPLPTNTQQVELLVQVSDYDFFFAGMIEPPVVGHLHKLQNDAAYTNSVNLAIMGGLFIMALYHFLIYAFRRKELAMLYFGLICLTVAIRFADFGDHYLYEWLNLHSGFFTFAMQVKVYYLSTFAMGTLGLYFIHALYPGQQPRWVRLASLVLLGVYALFALVVSTDVFTYSIAFTQALLGVSVAYVMFLIVRAAYKRMPDARYLLLGLAGMVLAGVHDALHLADVYLISETELLTFGFLFFLFVQFVLLSKRYSFAFNAVEDLSENLERKVEERTLELQQANAEISKQHKEIAEKNQDITDSIEYARRIQLSILPKQDAFFKHFPDAFILYLPKDIVSGDFYWFHQNRDAFYVCAADCTGHGVPGAFMSVLGTNLLGQVVHENGLAPGGLLAKMNQSVQDALHQHEHKGNAQDGMEMALLRFAGNTLHYAGANRPLLHYREGNLIEYSPTKHPIGGADAAQAAAMFDTEAIELRAGDTLYVFTDGITDQFGGQQHRRFSGKRLRSLLAELQPLPMHEQREHLLQTLKEWQMHYEQTDDILVMGIRIGNTN